MFQTVEMPLWVLVLLVAFAAVTFASHFLFPSVRWFFRRRLERAVAELNKRLERPIQPFKLARRHDMIQRLIYDPEVSRAVVIHARNKGVPENVAFETARRYAREIVPSFSASLYFGVAARLARWLSNTLYDVRLLHRDEAALGKIDPKATVVYVMNHRSNMDYVLVTYLAADRSALAYAVGEWARIWPLSRLIRAMGAYFIRRERHGPLYRKVLERYVRLATDAGVTQAVFPEGGLSLTGALGNPRLGILRYISEARGPDAPDVVFVPVALNYDRVLEDRVLIGARAAGERRFTARFRVIAGFVARMVWLRLRGRYRRFGRAAVSFGQPVSLAQSGGNVRALGRALMGQIAREMPVLPVPLVAMALERAGGVATQDVLADRVVALIAGLPSHARPDEPAQELLQAGLAELQLRHLVQEEDQRLTVAPGQEAMIAFYATSIAHLFPGDDATAA
ncbi:1-acyl-sn-glycerol-3-phosphate acyltransferase [Lutimaribacter sp. EGI FJ00015]|uniref:1-acyl-sn-glycerol-3-phosphate acyltransferase n=1 Tax=Lutimaribacter degradans TaxID=2945989 RepID=A0ACC5ZYR7_9RHOB|nr:1-acyl-sn-glycerol-3-phosphate acyltransferase [Lutimaribacter sp. EGI FJ00013]MCM2563486.1 1-acyl-sn-glycerol-3-phosphate acyltransferase [Lutimaribacter sp. EGI FJ00013]MCO0614666.1 1-acyl-sn-glycerol-3-phosphate acyltransferase [Lutimaribacter sp. EGI FJ00015]MCO0637336.1 1-acyl-sn-glycerol-3-phosphate acyltransferase [Lutimaribacter sp. EGI FJ00014]